MPTDPRALSDEELVARVVAAEERGRLVDAERAALAAEVEDRSRRELGQAGLAARLGHGRAVALLTAMARITQAEARRRIKLGGYLAAKQALDGSPLPAEYPAVATAVANGSIGLDAAELIIVALKSVKERAHPEQLATAEAFLAQSATESEPELLKVQLAVLREALDPDGAEPREAVQRAARSFSIGRERPDGMTPAHWLLPPEDAATIRAAIHAHRPRLTLVDAEAPLDERSRPQADYDIVFGVIAAGLQAELEGRGPGGVKTPHLVIVHATAQGPGWVDHAGFPISAASVERIMCSGSSQQLVTTADGVPLNLGRTQHPFTHHQKQAIAARDGGCAWPGCTAPAAWTDVHHVQEWKAHDGPTNVDNGVLLCPFHHHYLHDSGLWRIEMDDGVPYLRRQGWYGEDTPRMRMRMQQHPIQLLRAHTAPKRM